MLQVLVIEEELNKTLNVKSETLMTSHHFKESENVRFDEGTHVS